MMSRIRPIFTKDFWLDAAERAIKAAAGGAATALTMPPIAKIVDVAISIPWQAASLAAALAGLLSVLGSIASAPIGGTISPASTVAPTE